MKILSEFFDSTMHINFTNFNNNNNNNYMKAVY